jgi:hypothetical protein
MNKTNFIVGIVFVCFSLVYYFYLIPTQIISSVSESEFAGKIFRPETFPQLAIMLFGLISVLLSGHALRDREEAGAKPGLSGRALYQSLVVFAVGIAYVYSLQWFGYYASSPVFLAVLIMFFGTRDWRYVVPVALLVPVGIERFFWLSFKVILPEGELF